MKRLVVVGPLYLLSANSSNFLGENRTPTAGDTDPVRIKRCMETEMVNLPAVQSMK